MMLQWVDWMAGGAMTASGAGLAMQLFGGGFAGFGGWLATKASTSFSFSFGGRGDDAGK